MPRLVNRTPSAVAAALLLCAPPACVGRLDPSVTRPPTLGAELLSLDALRKDGLLTDGEYAERRARTIRAWRAIGTAPVESADAEGDA